MNKKEIIESGLLESYVLGNCSSTEAQMVVDLCKSDPEILNEVESIEKSLLALSTQGVKAPAPELKTKISSQITFNGEDAPAKIVPITSAADKVKLYKFGIAASLLLFATSFTYNIILQQRLLKVNGELAQLTAAKTYMAEELRIQQVSINNMNTEINVIANPKVKTIALNGMKSLDKMSAMIHWNTQTNEVYFNAGELPASPQNKQYQLWAIVDGKPVDAGMIDLSNSVAVFQKMKDIKGASAFAVTIEVLGGSPVPTMETMCFLGGV